MNLLNELEKSSLAPRENLAGRVVIVLKRFILSESIPVGHRLPPERQMADRLNISRTVLREALNQLIGEAVLERVSPRRLHVADFDRTAVKANMDELDPGDIVFQDLMQFRYILEVGSIPLICERTSDEHLSQLQKLADIHRTELEEGRSGNSADIDFHTCLLQALDNLVVKHLLPIVEEQIGSFLMREPIRLASDANAYQSSERVISEHQELIDAIRVRDVDAALETMTRHLAPYFDHLRQHSMMHSGDDHQEPKSN